MWYYIIVGSKKLEYGIERPEVDSKKREIYKSYIDRYTYIYIYTHTDVE